MYNLRTLLKNCSWLQAASIATNASSAVLGVLVARYLGSHDFGIYATAAVVAGLFAVCLDIGFSELMVREGARSEQQICSYLGSALLVFCALFCCAYAVLVAYSRVSGYSHTLEKVILVCGVGTFLARGTMIFQGIFRVQQRLDIPAKVEIAATVLRASLVAGFLYNRMGLLTLVSIHTSVAILVFIANAFFALRAYTPTIGLGETARRARAALPFGCSNALYFGYSQLGTFLLASMAAPAAVGAYAAAYRVIVLANDFPMIVFNKTLLPLMFKSYKENEAELQRVYAATSKYMFALGVLIAGSLFLYARPIVMFVYGAAYQDAVVVLKILSVGLAVRYLSSGADAMLTASDRLNEKVLAQLGTVICFVGLNVVLIRRFSLYGAAAAASVSELVMLGLFMWGIQKYSAGLSALRDLRLDRLAFALLPVGCVAAVFRGRIGEYLSMGAAVIALPFLLRATRFLDWRFVEGQFSVRSDNESI